ncbi:S8 family serine peptidase [Paenibacillus sp. SI8]|uniref:S8 family serine peptidase n=1 Tax=unclassified Paenibacillus TaxID=185978 RepID=UPI00346654BF
MKLLLKSKQMVSGIMAGVFLLSLSPVTGIEAAPLIKKEAGALAVSNVSQYKPENSHAFNINQNSPILYASVAKNSEQRVIVTFKDKKKVNKSLIQKGKGKIKRENKHIPSLTVTMTSNEIETLKNDPTVESVELDIQLQTAAQTMDWGVSVVNATYAWSNGYTGKGVKVAVLDTGIDTQHEDLDVAGGASFVDYTASYNDDSGHGTHVAGIIGAKNNDVGVVGGAPDADLYAVKVLDSTGKGYLSDVIAGIDWAVENKMDIVNMSIATSVDSPALHHAVDQAYASGLLLVAAAGNTGNTDGSGDTIQYPAKYSSVIAVGAVDQNNKRAISSSAGNELEIMAPGIEINSTFKSNGYKSLSGTSMAAPFVSSELALLKEEYHAYSNTQLRNVLDTHVTDAGVIGRDSLYGFGILNLEKDTDINNIPVQPEPSVTEDVYSTVSDNVYAAIAPNGVVSIGADIPVILRFQRQSTLNDGRIFVTGGEATVSGSRQTTKATYIYNPITNTWSRAADLPSERLYHGQSTLKDGRVMITAGYDNTGPMQTNTSYIYDPNTNIWTQVASLPEALRNIAQSTLNDGRVLVTGGEFFNKGNSSLRNTAYIYDPLTNKWSVVASMPAGVVDHTQSVLPDGRVMITGGFSPCSNCSSNKVMIYNPVSNIWVYGTPLPRTTYGGSQVTLSDGRVFVTSALGTQMNYIFDFKTNAWTTAVSLPYYDVSIGMSMLNDGRVIYTVGNKTLIISFNLPPTINVNNGSQTVWFQNGHQLITLSGIASDTDNDNLTISATVNGITKSTTIANTKTNQAWNLQWDVNNDGIPAGTYSNIPVTVSDGNVSATATYTGTIVVEQAPNPPTNLSPGSTLSATPTVTNVTPTMNWTFSDPDAGDSQSAFDVLIYDSTGVNLVSDSGWINSTANSYTVPAGILSRGNTYSWVVKVKDSKGAISPNSALMYIRVNTKPTLTLTSYTNGQQVPDNILHFTWTYGDTDGQAQKAYQVLGSQDNWVTVGYNSGAVNSANAFMDTPALASGTWNFKVLVSDGIDWSTEALRTNLVLPNAFEPNDTTAQAYPINYNQTYSSYISSATDVDYFKYTAPTTGVDRLTMTVPSGLNYDVYIYDSSSNQVAASVRGTSIAENVLFDVTAGNIYYVKVIGVGGNYSTSATYSFTLAKLSMQLQTNYQYDSNGNIIGKTTTKFN